MWLGHSIRSSLVPHWKKVNVLLSSQIIGACPEIGCPTNPMVYHQFPYYRITILG
jgi:hypothetical protein